MYINANARNKSVHTAAGLPRESSSADLFAEESDDEPHPASKKRPAPDDAKRASKGMIFLGAD